MSLLSTSIHWLVSESHYKLSKNRQYVTVKLITRLKETEGLMMW